jgi:hypothetical protein
VLFGVVGPPFVVVVRDKRAVSGVGAPISDFLGVSVTCLFLLRLDNEEADFALDGGFNLRPAVMNGCLIAA